MILVAEQNFTVERPVEEVFSYIANMENFGEWFPGVISIESSNDLPQGQAGKRYLETVKIPLKGRKKVEIKVVESLANEKFVTEGKLPPLMPRMEVTFSRVTNGSCMVNWRMYSRNKNQVFTLFALPLVKSILGKRAKQGAIKIKGILR